MVNACTIIARNYLAHARVLADSFMAHHQDGRFTVLIVDDEPRAFDGTRERFACSRLADIGIDRAEICRLAAIYDVTELATAVKPLFLRYLLAQPADHVLYLDPDIRIYGPLDTAVQLAREHSLVLTPHLTAPLPKDGRKVDDFHILSSGVYNLGFIGLGSKSDSFIDWWWQKTRRDALVDHNRMLFTDQRWIDFVPGFFEHCILKDSTYNVAYWNLHTRDLTWRGDGYQVDGKPLTFFHFSGFDITKPYLLSKHQADRPRILLSERPAVARICREYVESLQERGIGDESARPYGWSTLPTGIRFDLRMRRLYRDGLTRHEAGKGPEPPDPFDAAEPERFLNWLNEPVGGGLRPRVSRYQLAIYQDRPDLQRAFPDLTGDDWSSYSAWLRSDGVKQLQIPVLLLPQNGTSQSAPYATAAELRPGVNIAGYFHAELGIGEAARLLTEAIESAGVPVSTLAYDATASRKAHPFVERGKGRAAYDINIVCVNADRTPDFIRDAGRGLLESRYTIGFWFWELEYFPPIMHAGFDYVDEVWAATDFIATAVRTIGRRPVYTIPLPVPIPVCSPEVTRKSLGLPDSFMYLFMFDFFSILDRKNPMGLIRAFERAFADDEGPVLVIKTINGDARLNDLERLRAAAAGRRDILIVDEYYTAEQKNGLLGLCDCYVSLHRSEGFGLTMAEAMGLEKPVIATGYSGNLDFMTAENSYLVDYSKGQVPAGCDPYPAGGVWAEPDLDHAAAMMRRVYEKRDEAARKARQAQHDIVTKHTRQATAAAVTNRLNEIRDARTSGTMTQNTRVPLMQSDVENQAPHTAILDSLESLTAQLSPTPQVAAGRPLRRLLIGAQSLLFRVLRPYWFQQQQLQRSLIAAVRDAVQMSARADQAEPAQRQALEAAWQAIHALQAERGAPSDVRVLLNQLANDVVPQVRHLIDEVSRINEMTKTVIPHVNQLTEDVASHVQALNGEVGRVAVSGHALENRLYAPPYIADPERLHIIDREGRRVLGFANALGADQSGYATFEDLFRGAENFIRDRQRVYVPILACHDTVVDIGCGRGEMLDLLREHHIEGVGVDLDPSMIERCRRKGHTVQMIDGLDYLAQQADASVPAIFSAQVVEHMPYEALRSFLELSRLKLKPGGQLIFETVNPHSLEAFKTFYTDLTHQRPIFPEVAVVLCALAGFARAQVLYPNGNGEPESDRRTQGEYAVIATTAPAQDRSGAVRTETISRS
jgi:glycosyltransferase involved in cell wall biosynthesis/2-polyprenyl-3-methyl-5-hydroxy-6-metoxy-1,4-benzoquinol methylase